MAAMLATPHARKPAPALAVRALALRRLGRPDAFGSALGDAVVGAIAKGDGDKGTARNPIVMPGTGDHVVISSEGIPSGKDPVAAQMYGALVQAFQNPPASSPSDFPLLAENDVVDPTQPVTRTDAGPGTYGPIRVDICGTSTYSCGTGWEDSTGYTQHMDRVRAQLDALPVDTAAGTSSAEQLQVQAAASTTLATPGNSGADTSMPSPSGFGLGVYLGSLSSTNALYTRVPATGPYGQIAGTVPDYQAHHLNQGAVYNASIPYRSGQSILLRGNAFVDAGSPHYEAHASLERWWDNYRAGGTLERKLPTNAEYGQALKQSLVDGGMSPADAARYAEVARHQRLTSGHPDAVDVPRIPRRIPQPGGNVVDADLWAARGLAKNLAMVGRGATVVGAAVDGYGLYSQYQQSVQTGNYSNTYREGVRIAGGWAGAAAVGAAGAEFGTGFGLAFTPLGAVIGGVVGGVIGGAIGYFGGSYASVGIANDLGVLQPDIPH